MYSPIIFLLHQEWNEVAPPSFQKGGMVYFQKIIWSWKFKEATIKLVIFNQAIKSLMLGVLVPKIIVLCIV